MEGFLISLLLYNMKKFNSIALRVQKCLKQKNDRKEESPSKLHHDLTHES